MVRSSTEKFLHPLFWSFIFRPWFVEGIFGLYYLRGNITNVVFTIFVCGFCMAIPIILMNSCLQFASLSQERHRGSFATATVSSTALLDLAQPAPHAYSGSFHGHCRCPGLFSLPLTLPQASPQSQF